MTTEEHERAGEMDAQRRNYTMAGLHYSKALKADSTRNTVRLKLGQIFLQQGMFEPALTQFQDLRTREPNSAQAHQGIGHVYLLQGKLREAEEALTKAVALDPSSWQSHNLLGLAYDQGQRHAEAITEYKAALALHPREPGVLNNLGLAYALSGNHEPRSKFMNKRRGRFASSKLHNNLGVVYAQRQRYADALDSSRKQRTSLRLQQPRRCTARHG
jgi:Flp pilus assembly protein TadD